MSSDISKTYHKKKYGPYWTALRVTDLQVACTLSKQEHADGKLPRKVTAVQDSTLQDRGHEVPLHCRFPWLYPPAKRVELRKKKNTAESVHLGAPFMAM